MNSIRQQAVIKLAEKFSLIMGKRAGGYTLEPSKGPRVRWGLTSARDTFSGIDARHTIKHVISLIFRGRKGESCIASKVARERVLHKPSAMRGLHRHTPLDQCRLNERSRPSNSYGHMVHTGCKCWQSYYILLIKILDWMLCSPLCHSRFLLCYVPEFKIPLTYHFCYLSEETLYLTKAFLITDINKDV